MNPYRCETCKHLDDDEGKAACNSREEWISDEIWKWIEIVGCVSHSDFQNQRERVLDKLKEQIELTYSKGGMMNVCDILDWIKELRQEGKDGEPIFISCNTPAHAFRLDLKHK